MANKIKKQRPQRTSRRRDHSTIVPLRVSIADMARIIRSDTKEGRSDGRV